MTSDPSQAASPAWSIVSQYDGRVYTINTTSANDLLNSNQVISTDQPWHLATNFLVSSTSDHPIGHCSRYDKIDQRLSTSGGRLDSEEAMQLLQAVSQPNTQWSIVYGLSTGEIVVTLGQAYSRAHTFQFELKD